jgi:hypothetical protein
LGFPIPGIAQTTDSLAGVTDSTRVYYFQENDFLHTEPTLQPYDPSLNYFQKYNPSSYPGDYYITLGNIGLATRNMTFTAGPDQGFDLGLNSFDPFRFSSNNVKYYTTKKPYTELTYFSGKYKEQYFIADHSQGIGKQLHVGLNFSLMRAFGGYQHQKSEDKSMVFKTSFFSKKKRYGLIFAYLHNNLRMQENGGIQNDSVFEEKIETDPGRFIVNLDEAENKWKENNFNFSHYYSFTKPADTLNDSLAPTPRSRLSQIFQPGSITHTFRMSGIILSYEDQSVDTNFYPDIFFDSTATVDDIKSHSFENTFSWTNSRDLTTPLALILSVKSQISTIRYYSFNVPVDTFKFNHLYYTATLILRPFHHTTLTGQAELTTGNYRNGDTRLSAILAKDFQGKIKPYSVRINADFISRTPSWYYHYQISNNFLWDNDFDKENILRLGFLYSMPFLSTGLNYYHYGNYVFADTSMMPTQTDKGLDVINAWLHNEVHLKRVVIDAWLTYQIISQKDILRLPPFIADFSAYYSQELFKGALTTQLGFDLHYNSGYYADGYMPASRLFYIQDDKKIESLWVLDAVWKFQVKRTRFFVMYHHLNSLIGKHNYYHVPSYPLQDGRFKFGISWLFHD